MFLQNDVRNNVCLQILVTRAFVLGRKGGFTFLWRQEGVEVWLCPCSRLTVCCIKWQVFRLHLVPHKLMYVNTWPPVDEAPQGGDETFRMWSLEGQSKVTVWVSSHLLSLLLVETAQILPCLLLAGSSPRTPIDSNPLEP